MLGVDLPLEVGGGVTKEILLQTTSSQAVSGATFTLPHDYTDYDEIVVTTGSSSTITFPANQNINQTTFYVGNAAYEMNVLFRFDGSTAICVFSNYGTEYRTNPATIYIIGKKYSSSGGGANS